MLEYTDFKAWYPSWKGIAVIIDSSDFYLESGKITALTGLNGSGKTTLIKTLLGLNPNGSGNLFMNSIRQDSLSLASRFNVGYAPEMNSEIENKTCVQILDLYSLLYSGSKNNSHEYYSTKNLIQTLQLDEYVSQPFKNLSKGTKKRVNIAVALLNNPDLLILDEPFEGLDQNQRKRLKTLLVDFKDGKYILISSHELLELDSFCDNYLVVKDNQVAVAHYDQIFI